MDSNNDFFFSKDLSLSALLYAKGVRLERVNREYKICWFVFSDRHLCESLQQQFFSKTVDVNAKEYADAIRTLKHLIFTDN
ncbi:MAG TPA: DUF5659 domain-containing protein [Candidatus Hodarchaeales archaeon]|uniref:DUF5659 domain-containing protein n=1 Tax=Candidatus Chisholmbacteria bacterium RIFCSPLOWO2_01_FULL_49_14 TaxID=1797593 RepID=A0A1G1VZG0_9BACT|nr:MAG: hypothetical protein A3A65_01300 [Candidatus Chisholmbacteria bacterium RIFCSPLOWO2_01_FULL_49_14]HKZ39722.1 DUF5659 domain-containing protein [Candidatus Hodarchaeales archaeon]